jgi:hypothetical protein
MDPQHATDRTGCATNSNRKVNQKWEQCISCIDGLIQLIKGKIYRYLQDTMALPVTCRGCVMRRDRHKMKVQKRGEKCRLYYMAGLNLQAEHHFFLPANKGLS